MKLGIVPLPIGHNIICEGWSNLKGWWIPPAFVLSFWSCGCQIEFSDGIDYDKKKDIVLTSYNDCIKQYYRENVL